MPIELLSMFTDVMAARHAASGQPQFYTCTRRAALNRVQSVMALLLRIITFLFSHNQEQRQGTEEAGGTTSHTNRGI